MYAHIHSNPWNESFVFFRKMYGYLATIIGRRLHRYFPHCRIIVHNLPAFFFKVGYDNILYLIQVP